MFTSQWSRIEGNDKGSSGHGIGQQGTTEQRANRTVITAVCVAAMAMREDTAGALTPYAAKDQQQECHSSVTSP
jgi:hypothetical protein